jgi:hypothetical protein
MTLFIWAVVATVIILVMFRLPAASRTFTSPFRTTRERRSGQDRRRQRISVAVERRRRPRREQDLAAQYVAKLDARDAFNQ